MKILHIDVRGKIATYRSRDGEIVCGNTDYKVQFSLDEEWEGLEKTARFIWNGQYFDTPLLDDDSCVVPVISNAEAVVVGLYAENLHTTTSAIIYCKRSILCGDVEPNPGTGLNYTTEAQKAANEAKASATQAQVFAGQATSRAAEAINAANTAKEAAKTATSAAEDLSPRIEANTQSIETEKNNIRENSSRIQDNRYRIQDLEKHVGFETTFQTNEIPGNGKLTVPEKAMRYAQIVKIEGETIDFTAYQGAFEQFVKNYPKQIVTDTGEVLFDESDLAWGRSDYKKYLAHFGIEGNYLYSETSGYSTPSNPLYGIFLHIEREYYEGEDIPSTWESVYKEYRADGNVYARIGNLKTPYDEEVGSYTSSKRNYFLKDLKGAKSIICVPKYTEADIWAMKDNDDTGFACRYGTTTITFELR